VRPTTCTAEADFGKGQRHFAINFYKHPVGMLAGSIISAPAISGPYIASGGRDADQLSALPTLRSGFF
jgi:hypothetical protein